MPGAQPGEDPGLITEGIAAPGSSRDPRATFGSEVGDGHSPSPSRDLGVASAHRAHWPHWSRLLPASGALSRDRDSSPSSGGTTRTSRGPGTHLDQVAVGPVGPVVETIAGSDFLRQQLSGDEKEDGHGQEDFHAGFLGRAGRRDRGGGKMTYMGVSGYLRLGAATLSCPITEPR